MTIFFKAQLFLAMESAKKGYNHQILNTCKKKKKLVGCSK